MNSGITFVDVRNEVFDIIKKLKAGEIEVKTASEITKLLTVVIDAGKTQVEFLKALPASVKEKLNEDNIKAIAGTLRDRDAELDETLEHIDKNKNIYK